MRRLLSAFLLIAIALPTCPVQGRDLLEFTDTTLEKILQKSKSKKSRGLIYIWSPYMPLSLKGVREAQALTAKMKWEFTAVLDPYSSRSDAERVAKRENFPPEYLSRLQSKDLQEKEMTEHYPSLIPYRNGILATDMRGGYDDPQVLTEYLNREFEKIREPASVVILPWQLDSQRHSPAVCTDQPIR